MTDECYWNRPLTGKNGQTENGSRKYRDYYIEKNGEISNKDMADHFNISESNIKTHKSNYKWDKVLADKRAYEQKKREEKREAEYQKFIDTDLKNAKTQLNSLYTLSQIALIYLGVLPDNGSLDIPEDMTIKQATKILQGNPKAIRQMHNQVLRDLEKPNTINDSQNHKIEAELEVSTRFKKIFNQDRLNERYKK